MQLAIQRSANDIKEIKTVISALGNLYKFFSQSPLRAAKLKSFEKLFGLQELKIIEPSLTRWLAYEKCISRVLKLYPAILTSLEHLHVAGADLSSHAVGLLLEFRKESSIFF